MTRVPVIDLSTCRTVRETLHAATVLLTDASIPDPAVDARHLLVHALQCDRVALLRAPERVLDAIELNNLVQALSRRIAREPVSRIVGERAFRGLTLALNSATLDPRPDTETVVDVALALAPQIRSALGGPLHILDLGTGTGAIAVALLAALPDAQATATDISMAALEVASRNAERHGLAERIHFVKSHWLDDVDGRYHLIVANPPYIRTSDIRALEPEVAEWDPRAALDGGPDGLYAYRTILTGLARVLEPDGWAVFEVGHDQAGDVTALAADFGLVSAPMDWPRLRDLAGNRRCVAVATSSRNLENKSWNR